MRMPFEYVVIYRDACTHTYGQGGCSAVLGQSSAEKCFNTISSCPVPADFNREELKDYFVIDGNITAPLLKLLGSNRAYPFLDSVSHKPATINPLAAKSGSGALGVRASISMSFTDAGSDDSEQDPYFYQRLDGTARSDLIPYKPNDRGTFFGKYFSRNEYLWGRKVDWVVGYVENNAIVEKTTRTYVISAVSEPDSGGKVSIQAQDVLSLTNAKAAKCPKPSEGKTVAIYAANATSITVKPSGVGATYGASGVIKVEKELCKYTRSGDTFTLVRGQFGTVAEEIKEDSTVQDCFVVGMGINPKLPPNEIIYRLLTEYTNIPPVLFDTAQWAAEVSSKPWLQHEYEAILSTPESVEKILGDVAEQMLFFPFVDETINRIKIRAIASDLSGEAIVVDLDDHENIIADTFDIKRADDQAITRLYSYCEVINWAEKLDEAKNYSSVLVNAALDEESDDRRRYAKAKDVYGYWLSPTLADINAGNTLQQFAKSPASIKFDLDAKERAISLADFVELRHRLLIDDYGLPRHIKAQINSIKESQSGTTLSFTASRYEQYRSGSVEGAYVIPIPTNRANINLRNLFSAELPNVTLKSGDSVKFIQRSGVIIYSNSTSAYALDTGIWPAGVTVEYECEGANYIVGKGGKGGAGYYSEHTTNGGDAIILQAPITFSGALTIGGGGGGGGWSYFAVGVPGGAVMQLIDGGGGGAGYGEGAIIDESRIGESGTASIGGLNATWHNSLLFPDFVSAGRGGNLGENGIFADLGDYDPLINVLRGDSGLAGKAIIGYNNFTAALGSTITIKGAKVP